jgi:hypothetical protein
MVKNLLRPGVDKIQDGKPSTVLFDVLFSTESNGIEENDLKERASENPAISSFAGQILEYLKSPHPYDQSFADSLSNI